MRSSRHIGRPDGPPSSPQEEKPQSHLRPGPFRLDIVGLGSGGPQGITLAAREALSQAQAALGYKLYLEEAEPFLSPGARRLPSGMTAETGRAEEALALAAAGVRTAVVSGGDPGIYAMAGAIFEVAAARGLPLGHGQGEISIKVYAGTPALCVGASLLGAPLTHDFCAISLSDRLTPWELIQRRLDLASQAGFVIAIYNPRSKGRDWQLGEASRILMRNLPPQTPVGMAMRCGRPGEGTKIIRLEELGDCQADMQTIAIVGNRSTFIYRGFMITPRGYLDKYGPKA